MADTSNLTSFLEDIADAIRTKKVSSSEIPAANFDTEILSIETGVEVVPSYEYFAENLSIPDILVKGVYNLNQMSSSYPVAVYFSTDNNVYALTPNEARYTTLSYYTDFNTIAACRNNSTSFLATIKLYRLDDNNTLTFVGIYKPANISNTGPDTYPYAPKISKMLYSTTNINYIDDTTLYFSENTSVNSRSEFTLYYRITNVSIDNKIYQNTSDADITANDVVGDKVAYGVDGKVIGTIDEIQSGMQIGIAGDYTVNDLSEQVGYVQIITTCSEDRLFRTGSKPTQHVDSDDMASAIGLTADKIAQGDTILGITGTYNRRLPSKII